jgi:hypothetical protein
MNLKEAIQPKTLELETALGLQKPHEELLKIYKELKELQYKKVREEVPDVQTNSKKLIESPAGIKNAHLPVQRG